MANQILARLGIVMAVDSAELAVGLDKAKEQFKGFSKEVQRQSNEAAKETMALKLATETYGKSLTAVQRLEMEMRYGKYAGNMLTAQQNKLLMEQAAAYDAVRASADKANAAKAGKGGLQPHLVAALGYQTTDIVTGLAGGQNPFMVLLQQGGQLRDQFGGFKPMFQGIAEVLTLTRVAAVSLGGALALVGYEMYKGSEEQKKFNNAMILTGGYLHMTETQITSLSVTLSEKYKTSLSSTREAMQILAASGQFTAASFEGVAKVISRVAVLTGETVAATAQNLIPSLDGSAASAKRLNDQYHFLTVEQYSHIRALEAQGKKQEAIRLTTDALSKSLGDQTPNVGYLGKAWDKLGEWIGKASQAMKDWGKESEDARLEAAADAVVRARATVQRFYNATAAQRKDLTDAEAAYNDIVLKRGIAMAASAAKERADNEGKIDDIASGRAAKRRQKDQQIQDAWIAAKTQNTLDGLDKIANIELQKQRDIAKAKLEITRMNADEEFAYVAKNRELLTAKIAQITAKADKDKEAVYAIAREQYRVSAQAEQDTIDKKREEIKFDREHLLYTGADLDIALSRLKTEQEIAAIYAKKDSGSAKDKADAAERLRDIQKQREEVIGQQYELKRLQDMNQAVFSNMGSAIDTFVRTGKFAFKDFARSVIQDLIAIAMKAQMMAMFKGFSFFGGGVGGGTTGQFESNINTSGFSTVMASAVGGPLAANQPSIVGENGPELFVPRGAGTIVPNSGDLSGIGNGPQIVYNGPYIASMSAIDTQSATQFLAKNKSAVFAANQSASRSIPASR
jgi:lambda family phage tail tape measure protein